MQSFENLEWKLVQYKCLLSFLVFRKAFAKLILCIRDLLDGQAMKLLMSHQKRPSVCSILPIYFFGIIFFLPIFPRPKASKFTFSLHSAFKKKIRERMGGKEKEGSNIDKRDKQLLLSSSVANSLKLACAFEYFINWKHIMLWFSNSSWCHMPVLSLLRGKKHDGDEKIFTCYFQMILVVFQISVAGGVEGIWEVIEEKDERNLKGYLIMVFNHVKMGPDSTINH